MKGSGIGAYIQHNWPTACGIGAKEYSLGSNPDIAGDCNEVCILVTIIVHSLLVIIRNGVMEQKSTGNTPKAVFDWQLHKCDLHDAVAGEFFMAAGQRLTHCTKK